MGQLAANTIRRIRDRASLTQTEFASRVGVVQSVVSDWERGRHEPDKPAWDRIAAEFPEHRAEITDLLLPSTAERSA